MNLTIKEIKKELERWTIDINDIELKEEIGNNVSWAKKRLYRALVRGQEVAVKQIDVQEMEKQEIDDMLREVMILLKLRHPNILLLMGICQTSQYLYIVTELIPQGSIHNIIIKQQQQQQNCNIDQSSYDIKRALLIAKEVSLALNWIHCQSPSILHLNLKPANVLIGNNWSVKLADFSLSKFKLGSHLTGQTGSNSYMAPEIHLNKEYNEKCDVYSFGITLWSMLTKREPYDGMFKSLPEMIRAITEDNIRPTFEDSWPSALKELLYMCLHRNPESRPSFQEIVDNRLIEKAIIHESLQDDIDSLYFWKNIGYSESIPWSTFYFKLAAHLGVKTSVVTIASKEIRCLKTLLGCGEPESLEGVVSVTNFAQFIKYFPIPKESGSEPLERVWDVCSMQGFHGEMTAAEVNASLAGQKKGTYLIRFSSSDKQCFSISYVARSSGELGNIKVVYTDGWGYKYQGGSTYFTTFQQLLSKHQPKHNPFKTPLLGGPFLSIQIKLPVLLPSETVYLTISPQLLKHI